MLALIAVLVLAFSAVAAFGLHVWRPRRGYAWLAAAFGSLIAWGLGMAAGMRLLNRLPVLDWQPQSLLPDTPALTIDLPAWSLLAAVLTLNLAAILTGVLPGRGASPARGLRLAAGLFLSAVAGLAVLAGNLMTLALLWSLADLTWLLVWLGQARSRTQTESAVIAYALRLVSTALVVWTTLVNHAAAHPTALTTLTPQTAALLAAAAALRLGLLPPHQPLPAGHIVTPLVAGRATRADGGQAANLADGAATRPVDVSAGRAEGGLATRPSGLDAIVWLSGAAPGWLALVRVGQSGPPDYSLGFLLLGALAVVYAGLAWTAGVVRRENPVAPLAYWTLGVSALALGSAARGLGFAALAWSVAGMLVGGLAGLAGVRTKRLTAALLAGALLFSALPLTPAWPGVALYGAPFQPLALVYLLGQALLLIGYIRQMMRRSSPVETAERWVWLIYPLGLALLPLSHVWIAWRWRSGGDFAAWPGWIASGLAVVGLGMVVLLAGGLLRLRGRRWIDERLAGRAMGAFELSWLYSLVWWLYRQGMRIAAFLGWALEGRSGLLWALLWLVLLLSLLAQLGLGSV